MISFPDELLERLDARARALGKTRSGLLQELARSELDGDQAARWAAVEEILDEAAKHPGHGGNVAELVRADRQSH